MKSASSVIRYFTVFFTLICGPQVVTTHSSFPTVLVISMDAFRHDLIDDCITPTIFNLRKKGAFSTYMDNVFPTKTFPNHHSIATGVYPEVHGVLDNSVYIARDPCGNKSVVGYSYELFHANDEVVPLWTLNQLAGHGRHSGVMMWPGGDFPFGARRIRPQFWERAAFNVSYEKRIDRVVSWFTHPLTPTNLVFMYFEEPDLHGHAYGVESEEVREQIVRLDRALEYLLTKLSERNLDTVVNIFLISDHGMVSMTEERIIDLDKHVDKDLYVAASTSPTLQIFPKAGAANAVLEGLKAAQNASEMAFDIYKREEIPKRWRYAGSGRSPPILLVAKEGLAFQDMRETIAKINARFHITPNPHRTYGIHGYDNQLINMKSMFTAWGPAIPGVGLIPPFDSVRLFPTLARILGLSLADLAGPFEPPVDDLLAHEEYRPAVSSTLPIASAVGYLTWTIVIVMSLGAGCIFVVYLCHRRSSPQINFSGIATKYMYVGPRITKYEKCVMEA